MYGGTILIALLAGGIAAWPTMKTSPARVMTALDRDRPASQSSRNRSSEAVFVTAARLACARSKYSDTHRLYCRHPPCHVARGRHDATHECVRDDYHGTGCNTSCREYSPSTVRRCTSSERHPCERGNPPVYRSRWATDRGPWGELFGVCDRFERDARTGSSTTLAERSRHRRRFGSNGRISILEIPFPSAGVRHPHSHECDIVGTYAAPGLYDDQLLVSLPVARGLSTKRTEAVHIIRTPKQFKRETTSSVELLDVSAPKQVTANSSLPVEFNSRISVPTR